MKAIVGVMQTWNGRYNAFGLAYNGILYVIVFNSWEEDNKTVFCTHALKDTEWRFMEDDDYQVLFVEEEQAWQIFENKIKEIRELKKMKKDSEKSILEMMDLSIFKG